MFYLQLIYFAYVLYSVAGWWDLGREYVQSLYFGYCLLLNDFSSQGTDE